jgi:hypothetical protein
MSIIIFSLDYMNFNVCLLLKNTTTILYNHTINSFGAFFLVHIKIYLEKKKETMENSSLNISIPTLLQNMSPFHYALHSHFALPIQRGAKCECNV